MAYNYKITIEQKTVSADTYGERDATWTTYKTVWADMDDTGGVVDYESDMPIYSDTRTFKFRTHDAPDVTSKMRVSYDGDYSAIRSIRKDGRLFTVLIVEDFDDE
jgi:SPP1 family predicted phage head-tail adaptor